MSLTPSEIKIGLGQILRLSYVPRWVIVPMMRQQSVAEHSWRVAVIAMELSGKLGWNYDEQCELATKATLHDWEEALTGDTPSTEKPYPSFRGMSKDELVLKIADYLEALTWIKLWAHPAVQSGVQGFLWPRYKDAIGALESKIGKNVESIAESIRAQIVKGE